MLPSEGEWKTFEYPLILNQVYSCSVQAYASISDNNYWTGTSIGRAVRMVQELGASYLKMQTLGTRVYIIVIGI